MQSDTIHYRHSEIHATAEDFSALLSRAAAGHALWYPATVGLIGDCGIISGGSFHKSFNVYNESPGRPHALTAPAQTELLDPRDDENNAALCSAVFRSIKFNGTVGTVPTGTPESMSFTLDWDQRKESLAFLKFRGDRRYHEELGLDKYRELEDYIHNNSEQIRARVNSGLKIVVVYGVTRAAGWLSAVARSSGTQGGISANLNVAQLNANTATIELSNTHISAKTAPASNGTPPQVYCNQCVVLKVIMVAMAPTWPLLATSQTPGSSGSSGRSSVDVVVQCPSTPTGNAASGSQVSHDSPEGGPEDSGLPESSDRTDGRDILSIVLRRIISANGAIGAVVGSWKHIENFRSNFGELHENTEFVAHLVVNERNNTARIVKLTAMDSGGKEHEIEHEHLLGPVSSTAGALTPHLEMRDSLRYGDPEDAGQYGEDGGMLADTSLSSPTQPTHAAMPASRDFVMKDIPQDIYIADEIVYDRVNPIRSGGSDVYRGHFAERPNELIAIKQLRYTDEDDDWNRLLDRAFENEVTALMRIKHPHIVSFAGLTNRDGQPRIVTHWAANGTVRSYVKKHPTADREKIVREVASALEYLHSGRALPDGGVLVHGGISTNNVLIDSAGSPLLCGFGMCQLIPEGREAALPLPMWMQGLGIDVAPELHAGQRHSTKSDVFSFGMLAYEVMGGEPSKMASTSSEAVLKMLAGDRPPRVEGMPEQLWEVICDCWKELPKDRPTMKQVYDRLIAL